jgi:hypothetical protein
MSEGRKQMGVRVARSRRHVVSPAAAVLAGVLTTVMLTSAAVISSLAHQSVLAGFGQGALFLAIGLIGLIVAWHQPRNPMGWVLFGLAFFYVVYWLARSYALLDYRVHDQGLPFGWVALLLGQAWAPVMFLAGLSLLLFPDGRVPSARWKPMLRAYLALGASWLGGTLFVAAKVIAGHRVSIDSSGTLAALDSPTGSNAWWAVTSAIFFAAVAVCWVAWLAGQVLAYVRSSGERRLQLKWLLSGATIFILAEIALFADDNPVGWWKVAEGVATVGTFALPVSIGFGIMKFRLYDIDRIISRTLAYALVTGALVGVYAGLVLLATQVLRVHAPVAVAASTLVAAALFSPLRRRVQRAVDRKFNRARYDADQTVAAFAARLQDAVELNAISADLLAIVDGALEPTHVSLWAGPGR